LNIVLESGCNAFVFGQRRACAHGFLLCHGLCEAIIFLFFSGINHQ
jgi:hypothetical protein